MNSKNAKRKRMGQPPERDFVNGKMRAGWRRLVGAVARVSSTTTLEQLLRASRMSCKVVCWVPKFRVMPISLYAINNYY
jgi:hypothetical protein